MVSAWQNLSFNPDDNGAPEAERNLPTLLGGYKTRQSLVKTNSCMKSRACSRILFCLVFITERWGVGNELEQATNILFLGYCTAITKKKKKRQKPDHGGR